MRYSRMAEGTLAYLPLGQFGHAASNMAQVAKKLQLLGTSSHKAPTRALLVDHIGTQGGLPKFQYPSSLSCIKWQ